MEKKSRHKGCDKRVSQESICSLHRSSTDEGCGKNPLHVNGDVGGLHFEKVVRETLIKPVGHGLGSGWGQEAGRTQLQQPRLGVGRIRLTHNCQAVLGVPPSFPVQAWHRVRRGKTATEQAQDCTHKNGKRLQVIASARKQLHRILCCGKLFLQPAVSHSCCRRTLPDWMETAGLQSIEHTSWELSQ